MIPGLGPIAVNSLEFAMLALALIVLARSRWKDWFLTGLALASALMIVSWMSPLDLLALALFVVPPYFVIRTIWGNARVAATAVASSVVIWEVALFIYLRKYEWVGDMAWLDHPVALIGLSYILFRIVHLVIEAPYLGHLPFSPTRYGTYVLAFWTLIAGPIQRYEAFCGGLENIGRPSTDDTLAAAHRAINGLIKAFLIAPVFLEASNLQALEVIDATWFDFAVVYYSYPAYMYLNFSGYTDLIIAIARLCGMGTMPENFNRPYLARNVQNFWARWHISFSTWIRHYMFTPLSKFLLTAVSPALYKAMLALAVFVIFLVIGAWHGTTTNFLVFGTMHSFAIVTVSVYGGLLKKAFGNRRSKEITAHPVMHAVAVFICFNFVSASMVFVPNMTAEVINTMSIFLGRM